MSVRRGRVGRGWLGRGRVVVAAVAAWLTLVVAVAPGQGSADVFDITEASGGSALTIEANIEGQATTVESGPEAATVLADIPAALSYTVSNTGDTNIF